MKYFKYILFTSFLICCSSQILSQNGFEVIRDSKIKYEKSKFKKALKLLDKADKMNYGFCGNAWMESNRAINLLRAKIYIDKQDYHMARNSLDSISWSVDFEYIDSIKIRTYQLEYGIDSLANMIESSLEGVFIDCIDLDCNAIISLNNGVEMKLKVNVFSNYKFIFEEDEIKLAKIWLKEFSSSENYKLIMNTL